MEDGLPITRHWRPPEGLLRKRRFQEHLTHVPFTYMDLVRGDDLLAQAFYPTDGVAAVRWAKRTGRPAVLHYGGIPQRDVLAARRLRLRVAAEALYEADAVIVDTEAAAHGMRRWFGIDARVINPGVRLDRFRAGGERDERPTIACAAAVDDARKRVPLLLRAFAVVRRGRPDARLLLPAPLDTGLAQRLLAENPGVELFQQDPMALERVFQRAWTSALTAYNEAFGLVIVESLACGTPVVAARDGGVPEIVDRPALGRLFEGDAPEDVARALLETLDMAHDAGVAAACRSRAEQFSAARCAHEHVVLWNELLDRRDTG